jgi:ankyrin repeat protein
VKYDLLHFQAWLLSLAPPTRTPDTLFDSAGSYPQVIQWIYEQAPFTNFLKPVAGPRLLHIHANGNPLIDTQRVSRLLYHDLDIRCTSVGSARRPDKTVVYFEFDQHDSRYSTISALMLYLINAFAWRFWQTFDQFMHEELTFMSHMHAWSLEDLFHLYSAFRSCGAARGLTIFISCFDQCPADQRQLFVERVLEEQDYKDSEYRIIFSTSGRDDLMVKSFPDEARINLDDNTEARVLRDVLSEQLRKGLDDLTARRPVYEGFRPQLKNLLEQCGTAPYLGHIILTWLRRHHRGKPASEIARKISNLLPPTAENVARCFIGSLDSPALRKRVETVFNWVKHAAEPWSRDSLAQALAVHELGGEGSGLSFEDLDVEGTMSEIELALGGILTTNLDNGDVKFSHVSFYSTPEIGIEESGAEAVAKANSTIAETCLRYFQFSCAQQTLAALSKRNSNDDRVLGGEPVDSVIISQPRTSLATYAVRFWHEHYNASGHFKPRELADQLFLSNQDRAVWEVPFWLLSNPFTRMQRTYVSTLPVFAMLGLEDLVLEQVENERGQPTFNKDCWFAITEATRAGRNAMAQQLLGEVVAVDEAELGTALHWAAGRGDAALVNILLDKIPDVGTFRWPDGMIHQAAAAGLDDLLAAMLLSGCDINETCDTLWGAPPVGIAAWRQRVATMEFLLSSDYRPDLTVRDVDGDTPLIVAAHRGHPRMIEVLLPYGGVDSKDNTGKGPVYRAAEKANHKAIDLLIKAGAGFTIDSEDASERDLKSPLVVVAELGSQECVRVLLSHGADPNAEIDVRTSLYEAVVGNHLNVAQLLLTHDPKPDMDRTPPDMRKLLMCAVNSRNPELISLLIQHGAEMDFVDPNEGGFSKTPLSIACAQGNLEVVKLLLAKGANINYAGDESDSPLLTAFYESKTEVAKHLLQDETVDVKRAAPDGTTVLHAACSVPSFLSGLLQRGTPIDGHSTAYGTVLHSAVRRNNPTAIQILLAHDPRPEIDAVYGEDGWWLEEIGFTPLQLACKFGYPKCVEALLEGGASPTFKNKNGDDAVAVLLATGSDSKDTAECLGQLISVSYSIPGDPVDEHGRGRLHAIQETTPVSVVESLVKAKAPIDLQDEEGHTPLSVAVSKGNEMVARYLVNQGASVNRLSPVFGSILHLAVLRGNLNMVKFLVESGADLETVDPKYGESLLYTALGIEDDKELTAMVRYLVVDAKVPIDQPGGVPFGYPIIRAVNLSNYSYTSGMEVLKFLIRRSAQFDVSDNQGRRAIHIACTLWHSDAIRALVEAGAKIDVKDLLGRMPIHFAAAQPDSQGLNYLMDTFKEIDVNEPDLDNWTPLMWAARSGSIFFMERLLAAKADVWARGRGSDGKDEWSALKLMNFSGRPDYIPLPQLEPEARTRVGPSGEKEEWDDAFHKSDIGDEKGTSCNSCFVVSQTLISRGWCFQV